MTIFLHSGHRLIAAAYTPQFLPVKLSTSEVCKAALVVVFLMWFLRWTEFILESNLGLTTAPPCRPPVTTIMSPLKNLLVICNELHLLDGYILPNRSASRLRFQLQDQGLPGRPAQHQHRHRLPQRGVEHAAADRPQRHQPVAEAPAGGDRAGGRRQRARSLSSSHRPSTVRHRCGFRS